MEDNVDFKNNSTILKQYHSLRYSLPYLVSLAFILGLFIGIIGVIAYNFISGEENNSSISDTDVSAAEEQTSAVSDSDTSSNYYDSSYLETVIGILDEKYIGELPTKEEANYELARGFVKALGDQYTNYLDPEEAKTYLDNRSGDFEGIGVTLSYDATNTYTYIETVLKGYPAESAGLMPQDIIVEIDGTSAEAKLPVEVAKLIRGEADTSVALTIMRKNDAGTYEELDFNITRKKIEIDNITWKKLDNGIIQINISQFSDKDVQTFLASWDKVVNDINSKETDIKGIVVDLRNNPGGFVVGVRYLLEEFLADGRILMQEKTNTGKITKYTDERVGKFEDIPMIVLVNSGSASASEIFAAGISENSRGKIVGTKTVGKGVEQELNNLKDGSMLLVVFQQWLTPEGNEISKESPIIPEYIVENTTEDYKNGIDPQLNKALELLTSN